ncbi:MAG: flavodoxin domain-containing protein [Candidatus Poseidoniia archaeon]|jgi:succinate dehydrogenase/fumarate reductase-like Fe-S protein/flavodoxin
MSQILSVWIEEGCITCDACQETCPEVFSVTDDTCFIIADVRTDGKFDQNEGQATIKVEIGTELADDIVDAAEGCPVEVIKFTTGESTDAPVEEAAPAVEVVAEEVEEKDDSAIEIPASLLEGNRDLMILFGSQSGNCEDLAATTAKIAEQVSLNATVVDMAEADLATIASQKRVMIICSTWGEGEMPDNAQALWDAAIGGGAPSFSGVNFNVCALGDTSYDQYCESGKNWDDQFEAMGASRVATRVDCDVDYEPAWKLWLPEALGALASIDSSGTMQQEYVSAFIEILSPKKKSAGAVAASGIEQPDIEVSLSIFRYNPLMAESGRDTYDVTVPGHASLQDVLVMLKETQDGSLTFRTSSGAGSNPLCGLSVNGNLVLADCVRMIDLMAGAGEPAKIRIEPLPGHQILKDLYVSTKALDVSRERAKPWLRTIDRVGANTPQGTVIGVMSSTKATALHAMNDLVSDHLLHSLSETVPHNPSYLGPAVLNRLWVKVNDPRISKDCKEEMREILQGTDGVWAESDLGVMARFGRMGQRASQNYNDCRSELLRAHRFAGKSGRHVKWFCKTVKSSGTLNETILAAQTMGPIGAIANLPATLRMALGFTRTGGPMVRDLQGWIAPGKMPPIINKSVHDHHEVVALFNEFDKRF